MFNRHFFHQKNIKSSQVSLSESIFNLGDFGNSSHSHITGINYIMLFYLSYGTFKYAFNIKVKSNFDSDLWLNTNN